MNRILTSSNRSGNVMTGSIRKKKKEFHCSQLKIRLCFHAQHLIYPRAQLVYSALVVADTILTTKFSGSMI